MRRISSALTIAGTLSAGLAVFAALPTAAATAATAGNSAPATASAPAAAATTGPLSTATVNVNAPTSTYAKVTFRSTRGGVQISQISLTGVMTGKGCYHGNLYRNNKLVRQSGNVCAAKGQRVTVTWKTIGSVAINTGFRATFTGTGAPTGLEAFKVS